MRSYRLPRLVEELARHHAHANRSAFLKQLAKVDLLYLDDFGLSPLADQSMAGFSRNRRPTSAEYANVRPRLSCMDESAAILIVEDDMDILRARALLWRPTLSA